MHRCFAALALLACASPAAAQFKNGNQTTVLDLPRLSPRQTIVQRIGLSDITLVYHRPQVNGRTVFGDVVPYGRVWRTGANDNATIEFSDAVSVDGHPLPAGRYGVHMIPGKDTWTVIFSKNTTSWGSFSYDPKEDVLRITAKPEAAPLREALTFDFHNITPEAVTLTMHWERTAVPFRIAVDTHAITIASLRNQLRHLAGYKAEAWYEAALYCVDNEYAYPQALEWIDHAIGLAGDMFDNLDLKAQLLQRLNRADEAAALAKKAVALASPQELYGYGDRLLREKKLTDARAVFTGVTRTHPEIWQHWYGLARVQVAEGDRAGAKKTLEEGLTHATQPEARGNLRHLLDRIAAGQSIGE